MSFDNNDSNEGSPVKKTRSGRVPEVSDLTQMITDNGSECSSEKLKSVYRRSDSRVTFSDELTPDPVKDTARTEELEAEISNNDNNNNNSEPPLFSFLTGMKHDLNARIPHLRSDWGRPQSIPTVINATIFAFVIQLIPALILAELLERQTEGKISVAEVLLSCAIMGIIYAIFSGQPIVILGITGPVEILLGTSYGLTQTFNADYFSFFFWTCIWAGLLHILTAMVGLVSLVWKVTPFTSQIFEFFIATTFIYSSIRDLVQPLNLFDQSTERSTGYAAFIIGVTTCYIAWSLHFAETSSYGVQTLRVFLTTYNTLIAVLVGTALSFIPGLDQNGQLERVNLDSPWDWQPSADRPWIINPFEGIDATGILAAFIPGFMFYLLFIIDHNVSSILTQSPKYNLKKPSAYHWDFFVLGITFIPCALLGIPPGNCLFPQAPMHVRALSQRTHTTDTFGVTREIFLHVEEQRWSGLLQSLLMLVALGAFGAISLIPKGCLYGMFLYLGMGTMHSNEIWERLCLFFVPAKSRPAIPVVRKVKWSVVQIFTIIQAVCALVIFGVATFASIGYIYPAMLTLLVPFRTYVLERWFSHQDLMHLDPSEETEDDFQDEQRAIMRQRSFGCGVDEVELAFPTRAEFRCEGFRRALQQAERRHTMEH